MAETVLLSGPAFIPFTNTYVDHHTLQTAAPLTEISQQVAQPNVADSAPNKEAPEIAPPITKSENKLPHEAIGSEDREEPMSLSWWPIPEALMIVAENCDDEDTIYEQGIAKPNLQRKPSIFKKLESRLASFVHGHHSQAASASPGGDNDTNTHLAMSQAPLAVLPVSNESDSLFHVLLTTSHLDKDVNLMIQGVRICGSFDSLSAAKALAHRCLFDLGYEQEWFTSFKTQHDLQIVDHVKDKIVEATGPASEVFTVTISSVPNSFHLISTTDTKRMSVPLYHVVQTIVHYDEDESGQSRDTSVQGSYITYKQAREVAHEILLWPEEGIDKNIYARYTEASPNEFDCGYGENVVVHAVGEHGSNYLVSILKGDELEAERVSEAASAMR